MVDDVYAERTRTVGAVLIFNEIQTGLGRCLFSDTFGVQPRLKALAKILVSVPTPADLSGPEFEDNNKSGVVGVGGGPIAKAAIKGTMENENLVAHAAVRGRGLPLGVEFNRSDPLLIRMFSVLACLEAILKEGS